MSTSYRFSFCMNINNVSSNNILRDQLQATVERLKLKESVLRLREHALDEEHYIVFQMSFYQVQVWWDEEREDHVEVNASGGSRPGHISNKSRKFYGGYKQILQDYFGKNPVYDEKYFLRRLRMPRTVFQWDYDSLSVQWNILRNKYDLDNVGIHSLQRMTVALRLMEYGVAADRMD